MTPEVIMDPVPPGEVLLEEFLVPLGVSQYRLAKAISVPARRINEIVHGQRRINADTALRLSRFFGRSERFWLNLQARYDLEIEKDRLGMELAAIEPLNVRAEARRRHLARDQQLLQVCTATPVRPEGLDDGAGRPVQSS